MTQKPDSNDIEVIYLGAGRCAELQDFIRSAGRHIVLVDASETVCNRLRYETRSAPHIDVVHAAVAGKAQKAVFKVYNLEELSSLHEATGFADVFPGLRLQRDVPVKTDTLAQIVEAHTSGSARFDLIVDVCGAEGAIISTLVASPLLQRCRDIRIVSAAQPLFEGALPAQDIVALLDGQDVTATVHPDDRSEFVTISAHVDLGRIERQALQRRVEDLTKEAKEARKNASSHKSKHTRLENELKAAKKRIEDMGLAQRDAKAEVEAKTKALDELRTNHAAATEKAGKHAERIKDLEDKLEEALAAGQESRDRSDALQAKLVELEGQLEEAQAAKADAAKADQLAQKNQSLQEEIAALRVELEAAETSLVAMSEETRTVSDRLATVETQHKDVKASRDDLQATIDGLSQELAEAQKLKTGAEKANHFAEQNQNLLQQNTALQTDLEAAEEALASVTEEKRLVSERLDTVETQRNNATASRDALQEEIGKLRQQLDEAQSTQLEATSADQLAQQVQSLQKQNTALQAELNASENALAAMSEEKRATSERLETVETQRNNVTKSREDLRTKVEALNGTITRLKNDLTVAGGVDNDVVERVKASLKSSYSAIIEEFEQQIETLTALSKRKTEQFNALLASQETVSAARQVATTQLAVENRPFISDSNDRRGGAGQEKMQTMQNVEGAQRSADRPPAGLSTKQPAVILIGSVPRSGGTWVFNAVRALLDALELSFRSGWHADIDRSVDADYEVIKVHQVDEYTGPVWKTVTNYRPIAERVASAVRMGWVTDTKTAIASSLMYHRKLYDQWAARSDFEVQYDDIVNRPKHVILSLAKTLGFDPTDAQIEAASSYLETLNPPRGDRTDKVHDPVTLLHPNHRHADVKAHKERVAKIAKLHDAMDLLLKEDAA